MRMHHIIPVPVAAYQPQQKKEKSREPKPVPKPLKSFAADLRTRPLPDEDVPGDDAPPEGKTDILA
jgi:hypothetical protein